MQRLFLVLVMLFCSTAYAEDQPTFKFMRVKQDANKQPVAMQTAIVHYELPDGVKVDLVGAVHVGERAYYKKLNKEFNKYDVVLYELVAPAGTVIPKGGKKSDNSETSPLHMMQTLMKDMLGLEHQLERIDYTKKNFVHADMSPEDIQKVMAERGETPLTLALSFFLENMKQQNLAASKPQAADATPDIDLFSALTDPNFATKMKRQMAKQFESTADPIKGFGNGGQIIVNDRNIAALKVLQEQIVKGQKNIAVFYGAAHLPDMEQRLFKDFKAKRVSAKYYTAWDLSEPTDDEPDDE